MNRGDWFLKNRHGMEPGQQRFGTAYPLVTPLGRAMQSWVTAGKPSSSQGASPDVPIPCQENGRNAVEAPPSTLKSKPKSHGISVAGLATPGMRNFRSEGRRLLWKKSVD